MKLPWSLAFAYLGCSSPPEPQLALEGGTRVRVEALGPVTGAPRAVLTDADVPVRVEWSVQPASVAAVVDGQVVATGPGEALVEGTWRSQKVSWTLEVRPQTMLRFADHPASMVVGESLSLQVRRYLGEQASPAGPVKWTSSAPSIASVDDTGRVTALSRGITFITAAGPADEAVVELEVIERR